MLHRAVCVLAHRAPGTGIAPMSQSRAVDRPVFLLSEGTGASLVHISGVSARFPDRSSIPSLPLFSSIPLLLQSPFFSIIFYALSSDLFLSPSIIPQLLFSSVNNIVVFF
jgi:hypothetical protein